LRMLMSIGCCSYAEHSSASLDLLNPSLSKSHLSCRFSEDGHVDSFDTFERHILEPCAISESQLGSAVFSVCASCLWQGYTYRIRCVAIEDDPLFRKVVRVGYHAQAIVVCLRELGFEQCDKLPKTHGPSHFDLQQFPFAAVAVFHDVVFHFQQECGCEILDSMDGRVASDRLPTVSFETIFAAYVDLLLWESLCQLLMWRCSRRLQTFFRSSC